MSGRPVIAATNKPAEDALRWHPFYQGKMQMMPKCEIREFSDFAVWYTPGVAAPCRAIQADPELVYEHTNRANTVAIVSDGSRVLGLGNIGPEAGLPVMEGKSLLFKFLGGVDAVPLCLSTQNSDELIRMVEVLEPSFGGINLEDIAQPKCFRVLDELREKLQIPVWHDDQQGTATVALAGLVNALKVVGKNLEDIRIAMIGMGAANVATYRLLRASGVDAGAIIACDRRGTLHRNRQDLARSGDRFREKWMICQESNEQQVTGSIAEALRGADVCLAFSQPGPDTIKPEWVQGMAANAIVFAGANPIPEIWPWQAKEAGARIVATGRGDMPNQVNNSLGFPAIFRGVLDVRARQITDEMALAAARELALAAEAECLSEDYIVPRMDEWEVFPRVAAATAAKAIECGVARLSKTTEELYESAVTRIEQARNATQMLSMEGFIPVRPESISRSKIRTGT